jgi:glycosyltransferase involved in cell wall biosynthesis
VYSGRAFLWAELLSLLLKALGCHFIITMHGGALPEFSRRWPRRVRACLKRATFVTAPSNYLLTEMRPYRSDAHLIPNPLDIEDYPFRLRAVAAPRLIWLRRFRDVYNPELAPRIVARLVGEFPDVQLTMVGPDWGDGSLERTKRAAGRLGVAYRIQYTGGIDRREVPTSLNAADIFLNTTNFDNSPVSVIEAMACGLCIVTTGVGGIPYLVTDGEDALVVPKNDPEAAAKAVRRILTDPGLASTISANARRKAEHFDWSIVLPQWKSLLRAAEQY